jgi:hypothetical protein
MKHKLFISGLFLGLLIMTLTSWGETEKEKDLTPKIEKAKTIVVARLDIIYTLPFDPSPDEPRICFNFIPVLKVIKKGNSDIFNVSNIVLVAFYNRTSKDDPRMQKIIKGKDLKKGDDYILFLTKEIKCSKEDIPCLTSDISEVEIEKYTEAREQEIKKVLAEILQAKIDELIKQLGTEDWQVREKAQKELIDIGQPALASLKKALKSNDPEVCLRAKNIIDAYWNTHFSVLLKEAMKKIREKYPEIEKPPERKLTEPKEVPIPDEFRDIFAIPCRFYWTFTAGWSPGGYIMLSVAEDGTIFEEITTVKNITEWRSLFKPADTPDKKLKIRDFITRLARIIEPPADPKGEFTGTAEVEFDEQGRIKHIQIREN